MAADRSAVRAGQHDTAAWLRASGAADDSTDVDRFIGVCRGGDRKAAEQLVPDQPDLPDQLADGDRAAIFEAATHTPEAVALAPTGRGARPVRLDLPSTYRPDGLHIAIKLLRQTVQTGSIVWSNGFDARQVATPSPI